LQGYLTVSFHDTYYQAAAARFPDQVPPLTPAQQAALALFNATADRYDVRLDYWLEPGDMQFVNNHNIVHTRSRFEEWQVSTSLAYP
jgi:alpha-ketoglutarate-dependent taurine dioxygenase